MMMLTTTTTTKHGRNSRIRVTAQCAPRQRSAQLACCYHFLLMWFFCVVNQLVLVATADLKTSLLSETDDIVDELIDAELLSAEKSDLLSKGSAPSDVVVVAVEDDDSDSSSEDILLLDDMSDDDTIAVDPVDSMQSTDTIDTGSTNIHVQSNLQSLSDEELIAICTERGYEITVENDTAGNSNGTAAAAAEKFQLTHDDYVNAATQCLSMDKVVNQMIADDPDSAADMEQEVERIRLEKEKLQQEQDTILHEISTLEEELRQSGVDPKSIVATPPNAVLATTTTSQNKNLTDLTVDEVLRESFVQLFDRVGNDLQFVARMVQYAIVQPAWTSITFLWKSVSPTVMEAVVRPVTSHGVRHVIPLIQQVLVPLQPYIVPMRQMIVQQYNTVMNSIVTPLVRYINSSIIQTHLRIWYDHQRDEVQLGIRIVGAFVIPLVQSLSIGYQVFLHPIIQNVTLFTMSLVEQLSSEASTISAS